MQTVIFLCALALHIAAPHFAAAEITVPGLDSDYIRLEARKTSIAAIDGFGVFAKRDIPANSLLCEYRGAVVAMADAGKVHSDKSLQFTFEGHEYMMVGEGICAMINDCRDLKKGRGECHDGFDYNAKVITEKTSGKVFIVTARYVKKGEELFWSYEGSDGKYWETWTGPKENVKVSRNDL